MVTDFHITYDDRAEYVQPVGPFDNVQALCRAVVVQGGRAKYMGDRIVIATRPGFTDPVDVERFRVQVADEYGTSTPRSYLA